MVFGIKKKEEKPKEEVKAEPKTEIVEVEMLLEDKVKALEWTLTEYNSQYNGIFKADDLKSLDVELTSLNIMFAMFGELRLLREILSKKK